MAFLNDYKKRAVRRTIEYQVLMEDLVDLGVVSREKAKELMGKKYLTDETRPTVTTYDVPKADLVGFTEETNDV